MNRRYALAAVLAGAAALAGCTSLDEMFKSSKQIEYKSATKTSPLEVPPDLTRPGRDDRYAVPDTNRSGSATFSTYDAERAGRPRTGAADVLPEGKVRMERAGSQRWLVIPQPPEKVWPVVREFWQDAGFVIVLENAETGIMETDWAENRAKIPQDVIRNTLGKLLDSLYSTGERDKFRTRLERAADGSTEVFISHRGMVEVLTGTASSADTRWQPRPPDPELEAEFLRRLMVRYNIEEERAKTIVASAEKREDRAKMVGGAAGGVLEVEEPFDRAWRRVGVALDRVGFTVEDRDRANGTYYVRYAEPGDSTSKGQEGWLSKLAFWRSSGPSGKQAEQYRIAVKSSGDVTRVQVLTKDGAVDSSDASRRILALLHDQLK